MVATTKSKAIKDEATRVTVVGTCGNLPLVPDDTVWINSTTPKKVPGVRLVLGDNGCAVLDPARAEDKLVLDALLPLLEDGTDDRIEFHHIQIVPAARMQSPYPTWDTHTISKCIERVEELGLNPERCLRYELQKGDKARKTLVTELEAMVDAPVDEDPLSVPTLD